MVSKIKTIADTSSYSKTIKIIPYGTIGWLKTTENTIHQCKCIGAKWVSPTDYDNDPSIPLYEWRVAGLPNHIFSFGSVVRTNYNQVYRNYSDEKPLTFNNGVSGNIFTSREYANNGKLGNLVKDGYMKPTKSVNIVDVMMKQYGFDLDGVNVGYGFLSLRPYEIWRDNSIKQNGWITKFELTMDEKGFHLIVPSILSGKYYPSKEIAMAHTLSLPTFTFDNEDGTDDNEEVFIEYTFKVNKKVIDTLKEIFEE